MKEKTKGTHHRVHREHQVNGEAREYPLGDREKRVFAWNLSVRSVVKKGFRSLT